MIIHCPHCQQQLDTPPELAGKSATCCSCNGLFMVPIPVATVPAAQTAQLTQNSQVYKIKVEQSAASIIFGVLFFIIGLFLALAAFAAGSFPGILISLIILIIGAGLMTNKHIKCVCGYCGKPASVGGPNGCALLLLLCLGLLPGLIYYFAVPKKMECPKCGIPVK